MILNNEKQRYKELADFLKTRRAKILPSQGTVSPILQHVLDSLGDVHSPLIRDRYCCQNEIAVG